MSNQSYRLKIPYVSHSARHTIECGPGTKPLKIDHRVGGWLPRDHRIIERYISKLLEKVKHDNRVLSELSPSIVQFKNLIDNDPILRMGFTEMFDQVPRKPPYDLDPSLKPQIRDYDTMFKAFDYIITHAIPYEDNDLVGFPINAILDWPMGTDAGLATFLSPQVNAQFKNMFDEWSRFLSSPESRTYLNTETNGWFGPKASEHMPNFAETYQCDPDADYYGFKSWDDFFTREFLPGVRPVKFVDPQYQNIITSACESEVYKIAFNVKERDKFWLKGEPYSLRDMLNNDSYTDQFIGGTIYQAFLSAYKYHRWVSPVKGVIDRIENIPGTYYAESPVMGFDNPDGPDPAAPNWSQSYISAIAARALVWIKADNPEIGLMALLAIGMSEVSTCEVTAKVGDEVSKGDELGMFHFGGSTHCLIFRKGVELTFDVAVGTAVELNRGIAAVGKGKGSL
ncbi:phosphatidylserine decarboxylase [Rhizoctonia solani]|uniref:Phosphatidylserine decarboxylase n=1 Tax=Rhizoctonia solani TaxID=456999 RepID=A0A0K6G8W3_9AGAM|nr:phosphatidylserine decarboxylase [Rhizoctonia solani]